MTLIYRVEGGDGRVSRVLAELVGDGAEDHAARERHRLAKPRRGQCPPGGVTVAAAAPELGLVFRRPGFDAKLPGLRLLHDDHAARDAVARALGISPGGISLEVSLRAHRLGKRAVLRFDLSGIRRGRLFARLRPVTSDSGTVAFRRHGEIVAALTGAGAARVPNPVSYDEGLGAAFYEALPGAQPDISGEVGASAMRVTAAALEALVRHGPRDAEPYSAGDELDLLADWVSRVGGFFPMLEAPASQAFRAVRDALGTLDEAAPAPCHRDFHEKQILIDGGVAGLLDFDTYRLADPALDAGNLLAHLRLMHHAEGQDLSPAEDAFHSAVEVRVGARNLSAWTRAALLRLACIQAFTSRGLGLSRALIREAAR